MDCKLYLHEGENKIRIDVTNLPANRIRQMDKNGTVWRIFEDINFNVISTGTEGTTATSYASWNLVPSGLNSEIKLTRVHHIPTGISDVTTDKPVPGSSEDRWYTINGIRIPQPQSPGIYIHGGKKVAVGKSGK